MYTKSIRLELLDNSDRLMPFKEKIEKIFQESIRKVTEKIPIDNVVVKVLDKPKSCIPEIGVGGYAPTEDVIEIYLDPDFPNFENTIEKDFAHTLIHELHHCLRWRNPGYGNTLLEVLVTEGLADAFDVEITGRDIPMWANALTHDQFKMMRERAEKEFENREYSYTDWFFGSKEKNIPRWTGYTLGFSLVTDYLDRHSKEKSSTLYSKEAKEFT